MLSAEARAQAEPAPHPPSILLGITGLEIEGGIASVARCIARAVDEWQAEGGLDRADRVLLLDDPASPPRPPRRGEQHFSRGSQPRFAWQVWRSFQRHRHDLVVFDQAGVARSVLLPLPGLPPPRYAVFCHGIEIDRVVGVTRAPALERAWRLLANSERTAQKLRERFPEAADRTRVVALCVDPERSEAWDRSAPAEPPPRECAALIVGRMWSEERGKGHDALLDAWRSVRGQESRAQLWVVGEGDYRPRLEVKARALGVADAVRFLGRVPDDELAGRCRRASLFVMPSRQEGFGLVYAEAMWHGLPCIGSTSDAAGEVIVAGETGVLVPYGDAGAIASAVGGLLRDPARCRAFGEAGRVRARSRYGYPRFRTDLLDALRIT